MRTWIDSDPILTLNKSDVGMILIKNLVSINPRSNSFRLNLNESY